jgi:ubiquinone biosynthesis monooxygenase Coq7
MAARASSVAATAAAAPLRSWGARVGSRALATAPSAAPPAAPASPPLPPPLPPHVPSYVHGGRAAAARRACVDEMLRVDHAGETGAVEIYRGQLWALGPRSPLRATLEKMLEGEEEHLRTISRLVGERRARPTLLLPAWRLAGFALGAATALLGQRAALACTVAVETQISEHYNAQIRELLARGMGGAPAPAVSATPEAAGSAAAAAAATAAAAAAPSAEDASAAAADAALLAVLRKHRDEEVEHHDTALRLGAERAPFYAALTGVIQAGCAVAIAVARRV